MIVYLVTNRENGKRYVGMTAFTFEKRWAEHCAEARRKVDRGQLIVRAIKKYGPDAFDHQILEECSSYEILLEREKHWISTLGTRNTCGGYNLTDGGEGTIGIVVSPETRKKISNAKRGTKLSASHKEAIRKGTEGKHAVNLGRKFSDEIRAARHILMHPQQKPVFAYNEQFECVFAYLSLDVAIADSGLGYRYLTGNRRRPKFVNGLTYKRSKQTISELKLEISQR